MASWKRVYWSVWLANLITAIGMMSFLPFFPSHLEELGLTDPTEIAAWTGLVFGAAPMMASVMGPIWGSLGDRVGRKPMVLRALVAIGIFIGCMAFARSPLEMLLLRLGQGVFSGFVAPSITLVSVAAPREMQGRVTGSLQTALAMGTIAGPLLGAFVLSTLGLQALFLCVSGAAFLSALVILVLVREPAQGGARGLAEVGAGSALRGLLDDLGRHIRNPQLRAALWVVFGVQLAVGVTLPLLELYVGELWDGDPRAVPTLTAVLFSILAVTDLVFMPLWGRLGDRRGHRIVLERSLLLTGAALVAHALAPGYAALVVARVLLGVFYAGVKPAAFGLTAAETPVENRGSAVGLVLSARQLGLSISAVVGGFVVTATGLPGLFASGGLLLFALWWWTARVRAERPYGPVPAGREGSR